MAYNKVRFAVTALLFIIGITASWAGDYSDSKFDYKYNKTSKNARVVSVKKKTSKSYEIPSKITVNGVSYTVTIIGSYAFSDCDKMESVIIPSGVEKIEEGAFSNCTSLKSVKIPSKCLTIGPYAFSFCLALGEVSLPANLTVIQDGVFEYCSSLDIINFPSKLEKVEDGGFYASKMPKMVTLPASLRHIARHAFALTEAEWYILPSQVAVIGEEAFSGNGNMTSLTMPKKVGTLGNSAFFGCDKLQQLIMPETVGSIGTGVFERNDELQSVTVSSNLTTIPERMFFQCYALEWVTLPAGITTIGPDAFGECYSLREIELPKALTTISADAFQYSGLESITFPSGVTSIASGAFDCMYLKTVYSQAPVPPALAQGGFSENVYDKALLQVYDAARPAYLAHSEWTKFKSLHPADTDDDVISGVATPTDAATLAPDSNTPCEVYTLTGVCLGRLAPAALPSGAYLLRHGTATRKLLIP